MLSKLILVVFLLKIFIQLNFHLPLWHQHPLSGGSGRTRRKVAHENNDVERMACDQEDGE